MIGMVGFASILVYKVILHIQRNYTSGYFQCFASFGLQYIAGVSVYFCGFICVYVYRL